MTVLNDLDRFHLVMDVIDRLPQAGDEGIYLKQQIKDKLIGHKRGTSPSMASICRKCATGSGRPENEATGNLQRRASARLFTRSSSALPPIVPR